VALRIGDNVAQNQKELLKWVKHLNPRLNTEHWRVLGKQSEPKSQGLILHIDRDSYTSIKKTGYRIFTGLSQRTVKVLEDPEAQQAMPGTASSKSSSEGEGDNLPIPSDGRDRAVQGTPSNGSQTAKREEAKEKMETDSFIDGKERTEQQNTRTQTLTPTSTHTHSTQTHNTHTQHGQTLTPTSTHTHSTQTHNTHTQHGQTLTPTSTHTQYTNT
jgi:hypothetical protein